MAFRGTPVPAWRAAMVTALDARADLSAVTVTYSRPVDETSVTDEAIWFSDPDVDAGGSNTVGTLGNNGRDDLIDTTGVVVQVLGKATQQAADERAATIYGEVVDEIRDDRCKSTIGARMIRLVGHELVPWPSDGVGGFGSRIVAQVEITSRPPITVA
jgi:hypothetical protein